LTFPRDAGPSDKALFIAASVMLDFTYFEKKNNQR